MARFAKLLAAAACAASAAAPAAQYSQQQGYPQTYPQQGYPQTYPQQNYPQTYPEENYPQQYPQQPYPQTYPQQGYGYDQYGQNAIGAIIDGLIGNRYNVSDRQAIHQCAYAAVQQAHNQYGGGYGYGNRYGQGYNGYPGYNNNFAGGLRVTAITDVERRSNSVRVRGTMAHDWNGNRPYGVPGYGNQPYDPRYPYGGNGYGYGRGALSFRCDVDYRGYVRNVRIEPLYRNY